jgi:hypothetical protein
VFPGVSVRLHQRDRLGCIFYIPNLFSLRYFVTKGGDKMFEQVLARAGILCFCSASDLR